jgi:1,4-dihydroxy-2-naphthoate octaprenyltransferase
MIQSSINNLSKIEVWLLASRPKTLLAAVVPVIVGSSIAINDNSFKFLVSLAALLCSLLIQIGTNFVNDLYDFQKGADTEIRTGPVRAIVSGLLTIGEMKTGIALTFITAFVLGIYLVYIGGWLILFIGIISIAAGFAYTAGPFPLAYNGLGDVFVFIFFGLVATTGTYYAQTGTITLFAFWASVPVGALITNILVVNNYRDIDQDRLVNKNTLAVKLGKRFARLQYVFFMIISYLTPFIVFITLKDSYFVFLPLLSLPLSIKLVKMIYSLNGQELNKPLELTAKLSGIYGILFAIGILI